MRKYVHGPTMAYFEASAKAVGAAFDEYANAAADAAYLALEADCLQRVPAKWRDELRVAPGGNRPYWAVHYFLENVQVAIAAEAIGAGAERPNSREVSWAIGLDHDFREKWRRVVDEECDRQIAFLQART